MQKLFIRYMTGVILISSLIILGLSWKMEQYSARSSIRRNGRLKLEQVISTLDNNKGELANLTDSLNEDYLTRAYAFAYIIQQHPDALQSQGELEQIKDLLMVDELHVIDENGILFAGTIPKYFGMDFASTKQTKEFLSILQDDGYLIQDIQPNGAEQKIFQYIGVARKDQKGIVQIGLAPTRLLEAQKRNEISYIISRIPMDHGTSLFAVNKEDGTILAHSEESYLNQTITDFGTTVSALSEKKDGGFLKLEDTSVYAVSAEYDNMLLCITYHKDVVYADSNIAMLLTIAGILLIFSVMAFTIRHLLKIHIVNGIHRIMKDVHQITDGNLNTTVMVDNNPEFKQLSTDINKMVQSILNATVKVSKVIDIVDMPIGVFEFNHDQKHVMATNRLKTIMDWEEAYAQQLYADKERFMKELGKIMDLHKTNISNIYQLSSYPEKWIQIHMIIDEQGTFGVISDITKEMLEKMEIAYERDHDALTSLKNINTFKKQVHSLLQETPDGIYALLMMDIDNFKQINDQYGHDWGDTYLKICAYFLNDFEGPHVISSRRSGDEFCMFLHGFETRKQLIEALSSFYQRMQNYEVTFPDHSIHHLDISAGLAWYDETLSTYEQLIHAADIALYRSKNQGKGILSIYEEQ